MGIKLETINRQDFPKIFIILVFLFALPLAIFLGVKREQKYVGKAYIYSPPIRITVSNIHPNGFTVSWVTAQETIGKVLFYGESSSGQATIIEDVRKLGNEEVVSKTHYFNISGKEPNKTYHFRIQSGSEGNRFCGRSGTDITRQFENVSCSSSETTPFTFQISTIPVRSNDSQPPSETNPYGAYSEEPGAFLACPDGTTNPPQVNCYRPNPLYGYVKKTNGTGIGGAIVYLTIKNSSGNIKSNKISTITETSSGSLGRWIQDIANFYKLDFSSYLSYRPFNLNQPDTIRIEVDDGNKITIKENINIPEVIADSCAVNHTASLSCSVAPDDNGVFPINIEITESPTTTPATSPISPPPLRKSADISGENNVPDGKVNYYDLLAVILEWYDEDPPKEPGISGDISGENNVPDGKVNYYDLLAVVLEWSD